MICFIYNIEAIVLMSYSFLPSLYHEMFVIYSFVITERLCHLSECHYTDYGTGQRENCTTNNCVCVCVCDARARTRVYVCKLNL